MPAPKRKFDKVQKWLEDNLPACRCIDMMVANHKYVMPEKTKQFLAAIGKRFIALFRLNYRFSRH